MSDVEYYQSGFEAFEMGKRETDYPYYLTKKQKQQWKEGYNSAKRQAETEVETDKWEKLSSCCPWHFQGWCRAIADEVDDGCSKLNCAILYFQENYKG